MATAATKKKPKRSTGNVRQAAKAVQTGRRVVASARDPLVVNHDEPPKRLGRKRAGSKYAKDQPTLPPPDMRQVDERIAELDRACEALLALEVKKKETAANIREKYAEIGALIKTHDLECYITKGEKFYIKPAGEEVTHEKIKQKG